MRYGNYYSAATADDMVDISSISGKSAGGSRYSGGSGGGNKNKIIIIASIAAAVLIAAAVTVFVVFNINKGSGDAADNTPKVFTFADKTKISGLDISGKTVKEAKAYLEKNKKSFINPVKISVNIAGKTVEMNQNDFEYTYNIDEVLSQVKADADANKSTSDKEYTVKATVTEKSVSEKVQKICDDYNTDAKDAYVTEFHPYEEKRFEFAEAQNGFNIDADNLKSQLNASFTGGQNYVTIDAVTEETKTDVTADFLKKNLVKLASYETYSMNSENGTTNMRVSLQACNGSIIGPGEVWSFNECTGDSNLESNGYKSANVISEGKVTQGIGGGICQSSSTIYNAAIRANMDIEERYCHKWASLYVPTGLDATIDYPNLDLKLLNSSDYQMFLECKLVDSTLYATFWGYQSPDYDEIKTRNEMGDSSGSSYNVKAWRVFYKDGKKVKEEELPSSTYDLENGMTFYSADDDSGATDTNVDNLNDSSSSVSTDTQTSYVEQSSQTYEEPGYVEPVTEAAQPSEEVPQTETPETPQPEADNSVSPETP